MTYPQKLGSRLEIDRIALEQPVGSVAGETQRGGVIHFNPRPTNIPTPATSGKVPPEDTMAGRTKQFFDCFGLKEAA